MALMRTGRMAISKSAPGDPVKKTETKKEVKTSSRSEAEKKFLAGDTSSDKYISGGGALSKDITRLTPEQLKKFNEDYRNKGGGTLKYKEIRYNPRDPDNKDATYSGLKRYQGDFAHPEKDKEHYTGRTMRSIVNPKELSPKMAAQLKNEGWKMNDKTGRLESPKVDNPILPSLPKKTKK